MMCFASLTTTPTCRTVPVSAIARLRQTDRKQTDRQTGVQAEKQAGNQKETKTDRQKETKTDRRTDRR